MFYIGGSTVGALKTISCEENDKGVSSVKSNALPN